MTAALVLRVVDPNKEFEVYMDVCKEGVGEFFSQEGKVVSYESWKLKEHEQRYSTYYLKMTTVVHVL